ncbi:MAG: TetR/AcrR family transcriptional regulator [Pseudomonadales bacterium]
MNSAVEIPENGWAARTRRTRRALVNAAAKLMVEVGMESVSVSEVAKRAGVTRPGAYYHFKNREELLEAVREQVDHHLVKTVGGTRPEDDMYTYPAELAAEDPDLFHMRIMRLLDSGPRKDVLVHARKRAFSRFKREGHLRDNVDPDMAAIITTAALVAAFMSVSQVKSKKRRHKVAQVFGEAYYQGLFHGFLRPELYPEWPEVPRYTTEPAKSAEIEEDANHTGKRRTRNTSTRRQLLQVTIGLIAEVGEEAVSISEVARRAGVTRPGVYYHFKSLDELMAAVEEQLDGELLYTMDKSFATREGQGAVTDIAAEDPDILLLRVRRMLRHGANDPLIRYHIKLFKWHATRGHLKEGTIPEQAGLMVAVINMVAGALAVKEADTGEARQRLAKRFARTFRIFLFHGILDPDSGRDWPIPTSKRT